MAKLQFRHTEADVDCVRQSASRFWAFSDGYWFSVTHFGVWPSHGLK
jgi:hypothetical protein